MTFEELKTAIADYTLLDSERLFSLWTLTEDINNRSIEGDIVECGAFKGGSCAVLRARMGIHRKLWIYDSFQGMPPTSNLDGPKSAQWIGNCAASVQEVLEILTLTGATADEFIIREGWFATTFKAPLPQKVALLHCDADWYDSVTLTLDTFYPMVSDGGCIVLDDFGYWEGSRLAFYDFCERNHIRPLLERVGKTQAYWIKGKEHCRDA